MAFGSVATSKVKVILEAQDKVSSVLAKIQQNLTKAQKSIAPESLISSDKQLNKLALLGSVQNLVKALSGLNQKIIKATAYLNEKGGKLTFEGGVLTGIGAAGLRAMYSPLSDFGDFQRNMLAVQAKAGATGSEYNMLTGRARQYAANTSWDPRQVSNVMLEMASGGFRPEEIMSSFSQIMDYARAVGQDDPAWAARGIAAMLRSFKIDTANQMEVSKLIDKMTAAVVNSPLRDDTLREAMHQVAPMVLDKGGTFNDMMAWIMTMAQKGIDGSVAGTALKNFLVRTGKNADFLGEYGINIYDDEGMRKSARQILVDISTVRAELDDAQKDVFDNTVFGLRSAAGINALFDDDAILQAYSVLADAEGVAKNIRSHMESGVFGSLKRIWSALQDMFLEVGKSLENVLKELEPKLIGWFEWLKQQIEDTPSFVQRLEKVFELMVQIGIPVTAIGISITAIGAVLNGIQIIASALIFTVSKVLYPVVMGLAKFFVGIFTTCGAIGGALVIALAVLVVIVGKTFRWGKILQAMFNGGSILHGIKLIGWSLWESLKWASSHFFRFFLLAITKIANIMWKMVVFPIYGVMKAASYVPGLGAVGKAADAMLNGPGQMMESGINWVFDEIDKENERTRKEYDKAVDKYINDASSRHVGKSKDVEKRGVDVAPIDPTTDPDFLAEIKRRRDKAIDDWAEYVEPYDEYAYMPHDIEKAEKIIAKYRARMEKEEALLMKAEEEKAKAAEERRKAEEKAAEEKRKAEEKAKKKAILEAKAKEAERLRLEKKEEARRVSELKKQADLTKEMKPLFYGTVEAAKWLNSIGEFGKDAKKETELEEEMADHVAGIYDILSGGEGVALMGV